MPTKRKIPGWSSLKRRIYRRDKGICWACGEFVSEGIGEYHLGHIVDFDAGGSSEPDNLAVFCAYCNLTKPQHGTREEADSWRSYGGNIGMLYARWIGLCFRGEDTEFSALCESGDIEAARALLLTVELPQLPPNDDPKGWIPTIAREARAARMKQLRLDYGTLFAMG